MMAAWPWLSLLLSIVPTNLSFAPFHDFEGGKVWTAYAKDDESPWIKAEGEISATPRAIFMLLRQFDRYDKVFSEGVEEVTVLEAGDKSARLHIVWSMPFPFSDRDGVVRYEANEVADGSYVIEWRDEARPGDPYVGERIEKIAGRTTIAPLTEGRSHLTYTYYGELGGNLFDWMKRAAWRGQPELYFGAIAKALKP